jgi:hypothetical protein
MSAVLITGSRLGRCGGGRRAGQTGRGAGKTVGFDMLYFNATSASSAALNITVDTKAGFLYGWLTFCRPAGRPAAAHPDPDTRVRQSLQRHGR